jgi:hypothetical protein
LQPRQCRSLAFGSGRPRARSARWIHKR